MAALKNKRKISPQAKANRIAKAEIKEALQTLKLNSALVSRAAVASALGQTYSGKRDLYEVLGYKKVLRYEDFYNAYDRDGLATRIVDTVSEETWRLNPILSEEGTEKVDEYDQPSQLQQDFTELADRLDLWAKFTEVDAVCGYSRFGLLLLGLPGELDQPIESASADELKYVAVYDEGSAEITRLDLEKDAGNPRFGLPIYYQIQLDEEIPLTKRVHWSRIIHVKEGRTKSRIYGRPRLKSMYNRIEDLEKVVGSGSEAFFQLIYRGMALEAREGYSLPDKDSTAYKDMQEELDEFEHGLRRFLRLSGMEAKDLGGKPVDSDQQFNVIISYLAGSSHIPQRILIGAEAGNLASTQDDFNFYGFIKSRQNKFAEPYILRAFIARCRDLGILSVPEKYECNWPPLFELTEKEQADIANTVASAAYTASAGAPETVIPPEEFAKKYKIFVHRQEDGLEQVEEALSPRDSLDKIIAKAGGNGKGSLAGVGGYNVDHVKQILGGNGKIKSALQPSTKLDYGKIELSLQASHNIDVSQMRIWHNESNHSAMIAFRIPDNMRELLKQQYPFMDDEIKDNLHITLVYLGDNRTLDVEVVDRAVNEFAMEQRPIKAKLQGLARFSNDGDKDPVVCTFDSPNFPELFERLCECLDRNGVPYHEDHGFIPHMTLAYIGKDEDMPVEAIVEPVEMDFGEVNFVSGDVWESFNLSGKLEVEDGRY